MKSKKPRAVTPVSRSKARNEQLPEVEEFTYDLDFSEASTSGSDSDNETGPSAELVARIPSFCWDTPEILDSELVWFCPGTECTYSIDILGITEENARSLPRRVYWKLKDKEWSSTKNDGVQCAFQQMVSDHYKLHLRTNGVKLVRISKRVSAGCCHFLCCDS